MIHILSDLQFLIFQVIALTQTQLDKAMKPAQFRSQVVSSIVLEPHKPVLSVVTSESTVSSLLASEKIQFGEYFSSLLFNFLIVTGHTG